MVQGSWTGGWPRSFERPVSLCSSAHLDRICCEGEVRQVDSTLIQIHQEKCYTVAERGALIMKSSGLKPEGNSRSEATTQVVEPTSRSHNACCEILSQLLAA